MSEKVTIAGLAFQCVKLPDADFKDIAAIYVILCVIDKDGHWQVLDVGQTGELGERIDGHDRIKCWGEHCPNGNIWVCFYPMPSSTYSKEDRLDVEKKLRSDLNPPCGKK
jgi:hypothetical protein